MSSILSVLQFGWGYMRVPFPVAGEPRLALLFALSNASFIWVTRTGGAFRTRRRDQPGAAQAPVFRQQLQALDQRRARRPNAGCRAVNKLSPGGTLSVCCFSCRCSSGRGRPAII
jgi:hypothetical protein